MVYSGYRACSVVYNKWGDVVYNTCTLLKANESTKFMVYDEGGIEVSNVI